MNTTANEYLDAENGKGNGHTPKVRIEPAQDENLTSIAPKLRHAARVSKLLSDGAKVLFDHISDLSFLRNVSPGTGIVTMSKPKLADELGKSERTISRYRDELEKHRFIWTKVFWKGGFELTNWYIRGMANSQMEMWNGGADPSYGRSNSGKRRRYQPGRANSGRFCPRGDSPSESAEMPIMSGEAGQPCPEATVRNDLRSRTELTVEAGQNCPLKQDKTDLRSRSELTVEAGQNCPLKQDKTVRQPRSEVTGFKESGDVSRSLEPSLKRLSGNRAGAGALVNAAENDFMRLCLEVLGKKEMIDARNGEGNGGMWRTLYRQNPSKAFAVIREVRASLLEKRAEIKTTVGAYAMDLWKRFQ